MRMNVRSGKIVHVVAIDLTQMGDIRLNQYR